MFIFEIYKNANPDHIALVGDRTLTYGEMNQQIKRYRNVLYKKGVHQGDRVAFTQATVSSLCLPIWLLPAWALLWFLSISPW